MYTNLIIQNFTDTRKKNLNLKLIFKMISQMQ